MMTTKTHDENPRNNDLSHISGIGPARRRWLSDTFQIKTTDDLAMASVDEIYERLKEEQIISRSKIEAWIEQAKAMTVKDNLKSYPKVQEQGWKPFASFVIEFQEEAATGQRQIKAHYVEADKTMTWVGIEQSPLSNWMIEQLGSKALPPQASLPKADKPQPLQMTAQFNDKLQSILAKVDRLTKGQEQKPVVAAPPVVPPLTTHDRLQEVIAKAQRLAAMQRQEQTQARPVQRK